MSVVPRIVVLDYGSGNLRSAERALRRAGADVAVTADTDAALDADGLVVPGVGRVRGLHGRAARRSTAPRIIGRRLAGGRPVLGICVGMQVLFERGVEHGVRDRGLRRVAGHGRAAAGRRSCRTWAGTPSTRPPGSRAVRRPRRRHRFYFVHSYAVRRWELEAPTPHPRRRW